MDIFAAGCVLYQLFIGQDPRDYNEAAMFVDRFPRHADLRWEASDMSRRLNRAFRAMVDWRPEARPTAPELLVRNEFFGA